MHLGEPRGRTAEGIGMGQVEIADRQMRHAVRRRFAVDGVGLRSGRAREMGSQRQRNTGGQGTDPLIGVRNRPFLPRGRHRERRARDFGDGSGEWSRAGDICVRDCHRQHAGTDGWCHSCGSVGNSVSTSGCSHRRSALAVYESQVWMAALMRAVSTSENSKS
jgi:hypothetical protein